MKGENKQTGYGLVVDGNGVVYVATDKYITAISSTGSVLWATEVAGTAYGVPAIDNEGYIYYNDAEKGSLVKLEPATGKAIASLQLGTELKSLPTIHHLYSVKPCFIYNICISVICRCFHLV